MLEEKLTGYPQSSSGLLHASYKDNTPERKKLNKLKSETWALINPGSIDVDPICIIKRMLLLTTVHAPFAHLEHVQDAPTESGLTP